MTNQELSTDIIRRVSDRLHMQLTDNQVKVIYVAIEDTFKDLSALKHTSLWNGRTLSESVLLKLSIYYLEGIK